MRKIGWPQISASEQIKKRAWEVNLPQGAACGGRGAMSEARCNEALVANRVVPLEIQRPSASAADPLSLSLSRLFLGFCVFCVFSLSLELFDKNSKIRVSEYSE